MCSDENDDKCDGSGEDYFQYDSDSGDSSSDDLISSPAVTASLIVI